MPASTMFLAQLGQGGSVRKIDAPCVSGAARMQAVSAWMVPLELPMRSLLPKCAAMAAGQILTFESAKSRLASVAAILLVGCGLVPTISTALCIRSYGDLLISGFWLFL